MTRCDHCGGPHAPEVHHDPDAARREALAAVTDGDVEAARSFWRLAMLLEARRVLRARGYAAEAVYRLRALLGASK